MRRFLDPFAATIRKGTYAGKVALRMMGGYKSCDYFLTSGPASLQRPTVLEPRASLSGNCPRRGRPPEMQDATFRPWRIREGVAGKWEKRINVHAVSTDLASIMLLG
jgi:hypothetical protein